MATQTALIEDYNPSSAAPSSDDIAPDFNAGISDVAPTRCGYEGCSNSVTKPARGRTPKFCDEHRTAAKTKTGARKASWPNAETVELALLRYFGTLTFVVSFVNPDDGTVIAEGAPAVAKELVELGRQDKKLRDLLEKLTAPGKYGPLALAIFPIVMGLMANHGLLPQFILGPSTPERSES